MIQPERRHGCLTAFTGSHPTAASPQHHLVDWKNQLIIILIPKKLTLYFLNFLRTYVKKNQYLVSVNQYIVTQKYQGIMQYRFLLSPPG